MGNSLAAKSPAEILPVESYINDIVDEHSVESLGSTRFMKVAKAQASDGSQVLKVFILPTEDSPHSPQLANLEEHGKIVLQIRDALASASNCCTIRKILKKPRYAVLCRPYQKYSLTDRLTTRPFVLETERLWYIFQLFKALIQCEEAKVCHGDLKSQNILISSSNWLQIADFASFKPVFLPIDNPSSYIHYFNTARKQTCYIAPERFVSPEEFSKIEGNAVQYDHMRSSMDLFSAGCVVYELLCDGKAPFAYGELCLYRAMSPSEAAQHLERLLAPVSSTVRPMLRLLLAREPSLRPTAGKVLSEFSHLFPPIFDSFLFNYMNVFRPKEQVSASVSIEDLDANHRAISCFEPDDVVFRLTRDIDSVIWPQLTSLEVNKQAAVLFISLITANIRALRSIDAKVEAMRLLLKFSTLTNSTVAIDRVLPYLVHLATIESEASVRGQAILSIVSLLEGHSPSTSEEAAVFMDYLLPKFDSIAQDTRTPDSFIHMALASSLGRIAASAYRYMVGGRSLRGDTVDDETSGADLLTDPTHQALEATHLFKAVTDVFVHLRSRGNSIKQCLVSRDSLQKLHQFARDTQESDSDFLLNHMVTFFNIKEDWRLRAIFFEALPFCVLHKKSVDVLRSLFQQGILDYEEMVVVRAVDCIACLTRRDLLERDTLQMLLNDLIPFLAHPNGWIRGAVVDFIVVLDSKWSLAEVHCRLLPKVNEHTTKRLIRLNNKVVIMSVLREPIPRELWDKVMEMDGERTIKFRLMLEEFSMKKLVGDITIRESTFSRLLDLGLKEETNLKRMALFVPMLSKMAEQRRTSCMETAVTQYNGVIDLTSDSYQRVDRHVHRFGDAVNVTSRSAAQMSIRERTDTYGDDSVHPRMNSSHIMRSSVCDTAVRQLLEHKNDEYFKTAGRSRHANLPRQLHTAGVHGTLLGHLHEHSDKITQLVLQPGGDRFASTSSDGTVKIWSAAHFTGDSNGAVRSESTYVYNRNERVVSAGWACDGQLLCIAASDGRLMWADVSNGSSLRISGMVEFPKEEGAPEQIHVSGQLAFARLHHGYIYMLDYRMPNNNSLGKHVVWKRQLSSNHGLSTSFVVDPIRENWMLVSATNYVASLWDLRYPLEVNVWSWQDKKLPLNLWALPENMHGSNNEGPEVFVGCMYRGEVDSYALHSFQRKRVLWPSLREPLNYNVVREVDDDRNLVTTAMAFCPETGFIYSGDSLGALRRWHLMNSGACEYLSGPHRPAGEFTRQRIVFDIAVASGERRYFEKAAPVDKTSIDRTISPIENRVSLCHRTSVSAMACLPGNLLASASQDGVIKIWK